ncbi:DUF3067 family protein [Gloeobacter morelensis]|uniref:DUF3067 family protein n=1 Tax=Gloeobacter morelensis MG652769 TaxID=2781736 RepID=A0ABY3PMZ0_9CYAN|nr:DUF3067 family protein [Gloeobacter morelensis]UFP95060.1 DUF3067 family protein [Gloeobacter morelensis MG652769]
MTGMQLRDLLQRKWGRPYDVQLFRRGDRLYLQVMWRYLGQGTFALSEAQYDAHLERIGRQLRELDVEEQVIAFLERTREKPRIGRAVSLPLQLSE